MLHIYALTWYVLHSFWIMNQQLREVTVILRALDSLVKCIRL